MKRRGIRKPKLKVPSLHHGWHDEEPERINCKPGVFVDRDQAATAPRGIKGTKLATLTSISTFRCHQQTHFPSLWMSLVMQQSQRLMMHSQPTRSLSSSPSMGLRGTKSIILQPTFSAVLFLPHQCKVQPAILCLETRRLRSSSFGAPDYAWDKSRLQGNFMEILSPNASPKACLGQSTCTWQILSPDRLSVESGVSSFLLLLQWNNVYSKLCKTLQGLIPHLWLFILYV